MAKATDTGSIISHPPCGPLQTGVIGGIVPAARLRRLDDNGVNTTLRRGLYPHAADGAQAS